MSISFSGTGSGLPISEWITALVSAERQPITKLQSKETDIQTEQSTLNKVKSKFSSLQSSVEKFTDGNIVSAFDLFEEKTANVSNKDYVTATVSNSAIVSDYTLKINQLATKTTAASINSPGAAATNTTLVSQLANYTGKNGTFTMYINNESHTFALNGPDDPVDPDIISSQGDNTIGNVVNMINTTLSAQGVTASLDVDGKFHLAVDTTKVNSISIGANSDTSNLFTVLQMGSTKDINGDITSFDSKKSLTSINIHGAITNNAVNLNQTVTAGTFTIGGANFTIDSTTTLSSLIGAINTNADANCTASYDSTNNKLVLTAKDAGDRNIKVIAGTSNFTDVMGLTTTIASVNTIAEGSQIAGQNSKFTLNGQDYEAATNNITPDVTGLTGLTLKLLKTTYSEANSSQGETEINVGVKQNTDGLISAVKSFISSYNDLLSEVSTDTNVKGNLSSESTLKGMASTLRSTTSSSVSGITNDTYNSLAMIGITTGAVGSKGSINGSLTLDESIFLDAINSNPSLVKALLIGSKTANVTGVMQSLKSQLDSALDVTDGYFKDRDASYNTQISDIEDSISRKTDQLAAYQSRITKQFNAMDQYISQMKNESSYLPT
ncbi:MAG: flagellar filament capping protein FliD [Candidatus Gastranaerophilaceae bacterium]|jgi:flagellar hook-associated protein 2